MSPAYSLRRWHVEHQRRLFLQHVREADDGVERRAQFVAHGGEETALGGVGAFGLGARVLERLLLVLAFRHIAKHGDDLAAFAAAGLDRCLFERPAAHLDPDELSRVAAVGIGTLAPHAELDGAALSYRRRIAQCAQISGPVGDVDAAEQALAVQVRNSAAEQRLGGGRHKQHRAVAAVTCDHVGHVARQEPVAIFLGV